MARPAGKGGMTDILDPARNAERRRTILATARRSMRVSDSDETRRATVEDRLGDHPKGLIPERGQLDTAARLDLFRSMAEAVEASVTRVASAKEVPAAIADWLRGNNLPQRLRHGADPRLKAMPWSGQAALEMSEGIAEDATEVGLSHAFGGVAETGTLVLTSGPANPTTLNFLPESHVVVIEAADIAGDLETVLGRIRETFGEARMPRTVNLITGPSRSADIEQKLLLGAHGPGRLHIVIVDGDSARTGKEM
jgi:L-lactate dehydrogenase complex protein LldG